VCFGTFYNNESVTSYHAFHANANVFWWIKNPDTELLFSQLSQYSGKLSDGIVIEDVATPQYRLMKEN
jgi:hypothetical protein